MNLKYRKDIDRRVMMDIILFVSMFYVKGLTRNGLYKYFEDVRDNWITDDMDTIWQLSAINSADNTNPMTIGWDDMGTLSFFLEITNGLLDANPKLKHMRSFLKAAPPR